MPGQLVDVGGHRLHLYCTDSGSPTVVLEPGLGGPIPTLVGSRSRRPGTAQCTYIWPRQPRVERRRRQPAGRRADSRRLHTLLDRADVPGPYVLAGDSFGGLYAQTSPPTMQTKSPAWCSWSPPHPNRAQPCRPRPSPATFSVVSPHCCPRSLTSESDACWPSPPTAVFRNAIGTGRAPTPRPPATSVASSKSLSGGQVDAAGVVIDQPQR
jgi:hypothetical protein